jgi:hypothetical protein
MRTDSRMDVAHLKDCRLCLGLSHMGYLVPKATISST